MVDRANVVYWEFLPRNEKGSCLKKRSVGLVLMIRLKSGELVAILQRRGEFNHEKMEPESWPGGFQVTVHGKCEEGEEEFEALVRESSEELEGHDLRIVERSDIGFTLQQNEHKLTQLVRQETESSEVITWGAIISERDFKAIRLSASSGGLRLLRKEEVPAIKDLRDYPKDVGVLDRREVPMFPDERAAVAAAFNMAQTLKNISDMILESRTPGQEPVA